MSLGGWNARCKEAEVAYCVTIGIVTYEDNDKIRLSLSYDKTLDNISESMTIPKCSILRTMKIRVRNE